MLARKPVSWVGPAVRRLLPFQADLMRVIRCRLAQTEGVDLPLFSTNRRVSLRKETARLVVTEIAKAMQATGELERGSFSMRDLRRTAEPHMAALGISSDVRAQTQSHGRPSPQRLPAKAILRPAVVE